jgi:hypothetical protein
MQCKGKFIKIFAIIVLGLAAISFSLTETNSAINPSKAQFVSDSRFLSNDGHLLPREVWQSSDNRTSNPIDRIFQIIFILFFISPPLIVVLLFLIWCELKKRNESK